MTRRFLLALLAPATLGAQDVVVRAAGPGADAEIIRQVVAAPHVVRAGSGRLALTVEQDRYALRYRNLRAVAAEPIVELPGLQGLLLPTYDRVNGLSLPVGVTFVLAHRAVELQPSATYRSRLGVVDPGLLLRVTPSQRVRLEAHASRDTRSNDGWIYSDLINSLTTIFAGTDTRNYFRSEGGDARVIATIDRNSYLLEPYIGARLERVRPITAAGNVWSLFERDDSLKTRRPNPLVEDGNVRSAMLGADLNAFGSPITGRFSVQVEQSFGTPLATSRFLQLTVHGAVEFPTFGSQSLRVKVHGVATRGDKVPRSRYAYLGGSGTLSTLDLLEQGGSALVYVENRYLIPLEAVHLPVVGSPVLSIRDAFGGAGVGAIPALQHEIGVGLGVSALHLDVNTGVAGRRRTNVGIGISLSM